MKKFLIFIFCISFIMPSVSASVDIDDYTTTYYTPWMLNYNLTRPYQLEEGYKGGEAGQMCWALEICPTDSDIVLAGTDTSCIWKSTDGGKTWRNTSVGFEVMGVADIIFDPDDKNIVYALGSTGQKVSSTTSENKLKYTGIYKSTDCGETWERIYYNVYHRVKTGNIMQFGKPDSNGNRRLYIGTHSPDTAKATASNAGMDWDGHLGALYTDDGGKTFHHFGDELLDDKVINNLRVLDDKVVVAAIEQTDSNGNVIREGGVYTLNLDGTTITDVTPTTGYLTNKTKIAGSYTVAVDPANSANWVCGTGYRLFKTTNSGSSWSEISTTLFTDKNLYYYQKNDGNGKIGVLEYGPADNGSARLYCCLNLSQYNLPYSDDGGKNWSKPAKAANSVEFIKDNQGWGAEPYAIDPNNPNKVILSFDGELYMSNDGGATYDASSGGYSGMRAVDFDFDPNDPSKMFMAFIDRGYVYTMPSGNGEKYPVVYYDASEDGPNTGLSLRTYYGSKTTHAVAVNPNYPNMVLINTEGMIMVSMDGGKTMTSIIEQDGIYYYDGSTSRPAKDTLNPLNIGNAPIMFNKDDENVMIYAGEYVITYKGGSDISFAQTNPNGFSRTYIASNNRETTVWVDTPVKILACSAANSDTVYGVVGSTICVSHDCGVTWQVMCKAYFGGGVQEMISDNRKNGAVYVSNYGALWHIQADGTYKDITPKLDNNKFAGVGLAQDPKNPDHLVVGGADNTNVGVADGIYETYDNGTTWRLVKGLPGSADVWEMEFHPTEPRVYIGTSSGTFVYEYEKYDENSLVVTDVVKTRKSLAKKTEPDVIKRTYQIQAENIAQKITGSSATEKKSYIVQWSEKNNLQYTAYYSYDISSLAENADEIDKVYIGLTTTKEHSSIRVVMRSCDPTVKLDSNTQYTDLPKADGKLEKNFYASAERVNLDEYAKVDPYGVNYTAATSEVGIDITDYAKSLIGTSNRMNISVSAREIANPEQGSSYYLLVVYKSDTSEKDVYSMKVWNVTEQTQTAEGILGAYDVGDVLLSVSKGNTLTMPPLRDNAYDIIIPGKLGEKLKLYLWDDNLSPANEWLEIND